MQFIFREISLGRSHWIASSVVAAELRKNPLIEQRLGALSLLLFATEFRYPAHHDWQRASLLRSLGYGDFDALHLAVAESAKADFLLTTDDRFLRRARRIVGMPLIRVVNPLDYLREVTP